jgi:hypothetical protein
LKLQNAWPTKVTGTSLVNDGNQVRIDAILFAYETLLVTSPSTPGG